MIALRISLVFALFHLYLLTGCEQAVPTAPPTGASSQAPPPPPTPTQTIAEVVGAAKPPARMPRYTVPTLRQLNHHRGVTEAPAFSPDGKLIATASLSDGDIVLWNWPGGTRKEVINVFDGPGIVRLSFSHDSRMLAYASLGRSFGVFEISSGKRIHRVEDSHYHYYHGLHWSADDHYLYAVANYARDSEIHRLTLLMGEKEVVVPKFENRDACFCEFDPAPLLIQAWEESPERVSLIKLGASIDIDSPLLAFTAPTAEMGVPYSFAISHDGTHFAVCEGNSLQINVHETKTAKLVGGITVTEDQLGSFQFIPGSNSKLIVYSGNNTWRYSSVAVRDITRPKLVSRLEVHAETTVSGVSLSRDGKLLGLGFYDGQAGIWDVTAIENALSP